MAKPKKPLFYENHLGLYHHTLFVAWDKRSWEALVEVLALAEQYEELPTQAGLTYAISNKDSGAHALVVWINLELYKSKLALMNTIAHEAYHCSQDVWEVINAGSLELNVANEPFAYLIGWFTEGIADALPRRWQKLPLSKDLT